MPRERTSPAPAPLRCPHCTYDATRTLADGLGACPECGSPISEETCRLTPYDVTRTGSLIDSAMLIVPTPITLGAIGVYAIADVPFRVVTLTLLASVAVALAGLRWTRGAEHWSPRDWASLGVTLLLLNGSIVFVLGFGTLVLFAIAHALSP